MLPFSSLLTLRTTTPLLPHQLSVFYWLPGLHSLCACPRAPTESLFLLFLLASCFTESVLELAVDMAPSPHSECSTVCLHLRSRCGIKQPVHRESSMKWYLVLSGPRVHGKQSLLSHQICLLGTCCIWVWEHSDQDWRKLLSVLSALLCSY